LKYKRLNSFPQLILLRIHLSGNLIQQIKYIVTFCLLENMLYMLFDGPFGNIHQYVQPEELKHEVVPKKAMNFLKAFFSKYNRLKLAN